MAFRKHHSTSATAAAATAKKIFHRGRGILNSAINKLPFELHYPGYHFLGPGTKLRKRIAQGDKGINKLDEAAKRHDLFYEQHKDTKSRHSADKALENEAWERVKAPDSKLSEKVAAYLTTNAMKVKRICHISQSTPEAKKLVEFMKILPWSIPLSNVDINNIIQQIPQLLKYFRGVFSRDEILPLLKKPKNIECSILNLDTRNGPGSHWTAYFKIRKNIYY